MRIDDIFIFEDEFDKSNKNKWLQRDQYLHADIWVKRNEGGRFIGRAQQHYGGEFIAGADGTSIQEVELKLKQIIDKQIKELPRFDESAGPVVLLDFNSKVLDFLKQPGIGVDGPPFYVKLSGSSTEPRLIVATNEAVEVLGDADLKRAKFKVTGRRHKDPRYAHFLGANIPTVDIMPLNLPRNSRYTMGQPVVGDTEVEIPLIFHSIVLDKSNRALLPVPSVTVTANR